MDDLNDYYHLADTEQSGYIGRRTLAEIIEGFHTGKLLASQAASKSDGRSYDQLMNSGSPVLWVRVADLVQNPQLAELGAAAIRAQAEERQRSEKEAEQNRQAMQRGIIGALIGGLIGFLLRPSASFLGQLDFLTVFTRGANLSGMDRLLVSVAETSSNYLLVGIVVGALVGIGANRFLSTNSHRLAITLQHSQASAPISVEGSFSSAASGSDIAENIKKLAQLKNEGILTEEEFQEKKVELLKKI